MSLNNRKFLFRRVMDFASIALLLAFCILYPGWVKDGYLDTLYLKIAVAIAAYGGLIANVVWIYKDVKRRGW
tara:strand:+ start:405 stop:620 length:216 start_codon:yes stop_codon:yes gene_type:complete